MKIDKKTVDRIASMPDDSLWSVIQALGASSGFDLSGVSVTGDQLSKIRSALSTMTDSDIKRAMEILADAKDGKNSIE